MLELKKDFIWKIKKKSKSSVLVTRLTAAFVRLSLISWQANSFAKVHFESTL